MDTKSTVYLVADSKIVRECMRMVLEGEHLIVGDSGTTEAFDLVRQLHPGILLVNQDFPVSEDELRFIKGIVQASFTTRIVVLASLDHPNHVFNLIQVGSTGVLSRDSDLDEVQAAIRTIAQGKNYFSSTALSQLTASIQKQARPYLQLVDTLTSREEEVLHLISLGHTNIQIAGELSITESTARTHVHNILEKLGLDNRTQAATYSLYRPEPVRKVS